MKEQEPEKKMSKQEVSELQLIPVELNSRTSQLVWKAGMVNLLVIAALFVMSYYVNERLVAWCLLLIPFIDWLMGYIGRTCSFPADSLFYRGWDNTLGCLLALVFVGCFLTDFPANGILLVFCIVFMVALAILYEVVGVRYSSMALVAACGMLFSSFRYTIDAEATIRFGLLNFFFFNLLALVLGGYVMKWQIKKRVKNPINFPTHKP